ncbi:hypothetical protein L6452_15530 [Arctium lappa]|uniref:Uncharacterized protein n=1 Tax=Arctium lappa TaxID=4217 RepID=A0ACB9CP20_ARCLA|nr:hypothetical protein L6452_15530 [Arctium lappa]
MRALATEERKKILLDVVAALEANEQFIMLENDADVEPARDAGYDETLVARLTLKASKACICSNSRNLIRALAESVRKLAEMEEPIDHVLKRIELAEGLVLEKKTCPLGVLLIVFESRPDALVQIASLAIRSGNGLLLKRGKEAKRILHKSEGGWRDALNERTPHLMRCFALCDLYENDSIFDKFECCLSGDGKRVATGSYRSDLHFLDCTRAGMDFVDFAPSSEKL